MQKKKRHANKNQHSHHDRAEGGGGEPPGTHHKSESPSGRRIAGERARGNGILFGVISNGPPLAMVSFFGASRALAASRKLSEVVCAVLLAAGPREHPRPQNRRHLAKTGGAKLGSRAYVQQQARDASRDRNISRGQLRRGRWISRGPLRACRGPWLNAEGAAG